MTETTTAEHLNDASAAGVRRWWRYALPLVAALAAWRGVALGLAEYQYRAGQPEAALSWLQDHPKANYRAAEAADAQSVVHLQRAVAANPADPWPLVGLAEYWYGRGDLRRADDAAEAAARLAPHDAPLHLRLANHWLRRDDTGRALAAWSTALAADDSLRGRLYPILLRLAESPGGAALMAGPARTPAPWWEGFFQYAAREAELDTVHRLMELRQSQGAVGAAERAAYVERLQREGQWGAAYMSWLNGLSQRQRRALGTVFNGGFEQPLSGGGFGWAVDPRAPASIDVGRTYGTAGRHALQVVFRGEARPFRGLEQALFLAPGHYRLRGRARPDNLNAAQGVRWELTCAGAATLGVSAPFVGVDQWRPFWVEITVPPTGCPGQRLRLVSRGETAADHRIKGSVWFDGLTIKPW